MGCGCGKNRLAQMRGNFVDLKSDGMSMIRLAGDAPNCEPYHGAFTGTYFHVVGADTEFEKIYLRSGRRDAIQYAKDHGNLPISNLVLATSLCHDRVFALLGA